MKKPNVLVIMCDDLGYGDLSCMGSETVYTPHIDALAAEGVLFRSLYCSSPVCSPSRATLLTGRHPAHTGVRAILPGARSTRGMTPDVPSMPSVFHDAGYQTYFCGKWHLGVAEQSRPHQHGFDHWYGFLAGCLDYYSHIFYYGMTDGKLNPTHDLWRDNEEIYENGSYLTERITEESISAIRRARESDKPFFLYTAYNAPHYPMHAPEKYVSRFAHLPWDKRMMAAMISAMDDGVGEILNELRVHGELENTIVYFQSDNGPSSESRNFMDGSVDPYYGGSAGALRGYKFSLFEGGIRVPAIIRYPAALKKGLVCEEPVMAMDIAPTLYDIAGVEAPAGMDGENMRSVMEGKAAPEARLLFWELEMQTAVRRGDWKLILNPVEDGARRVVAERFLAHITEDISEQQNLCGEYPALADELEALARNWRAGIDDYWNEHYAQ